jgi:predicted nuclease of restriction endonuclease-like RecB superfamily
VRDLVGDDPQRLVYQGLAKLLGDRCEFETVSELPPDQLREKVFQAAAAHRRNMIDEPMRHHFDRDRVIDEVAQAIGLSVEAIDHSLFADLKSEQRLIRFRDTTAARLLERYNVALAQTVLLRSIQVRVLIRSEAPQRFRHLLRFAKFHRLICEIGRVGDGAGHARDSRDSRITPAARRVKAPATSNASAYRLLLDGPLSLFTATQKYGIQLAMFLPAILLCRDFELESDLLWGAQKKPKIFKLTSDDGLVSHLADTASYVPTELKMFVELFRKTITDWNIEEETEVVSLPNGIWVPDFRLHHQQSGKTVLLEVLGFWRRSGAERHLERLRESIAEPVLLAVSDRLCIDEEKLRDLPGGIHRFRQMPLPEEIARLANELIDKRSSQ